MPNSPATRPGSVGRQSGCVDRYEVGSARSTPRNTSATIRPPTGPRCRPPATSSVERGQRESQVALPKRGDAAAVKSFPDGLEGERSGAFFTASFGHDPSSLAAGASPPLRHRLRGAPDVPSPGGHALAPVVTPPRNASTDDRSMRAAVFVDQHGMSPVLVTPRIVQAPLIVAKVGPPESP